MPRYASKSAWRNLSFSDAVAVETEARQASSSFCENVALDDSSVVQASHAKKEVRRKEANVTTSRFITEHLIESQRINPLGEKQVERMRRNPKKRDWDKMDDLAAYNLWLKDYLLQGNHITHFYDYDYPHFVVVSDPNKQHPQGSLSNMCGAKSREYILSPKIDAEEHSHKFVSRSSHNNMYGWTNGGEKAVAYGGWVPAYANTIDKDIMVDKSVQEEVRRPILVGVGEENQQSRASAARDGFYEIKHGYRKHQIQSIIDTGKARYATARDVAKYFGGDTPRKFYDSDRCIYVHDPRGVVFPETFGANSLTILLNSKYDVDEWGGKLVHWWDHSTILGKSGFKTTSFSGSNRPHNPDGNDRDIEEMAHALTWHVNSLDNSNAPTLNESTIPMHVDFSKGDGWAFDSFLYRESQYYHFKNKNPVGYLSRKGRVQVTFIAKDVAVVTSVTGIDRRVPAPFIVLSAAKPMSQDLTGYSYIVESVKPGGEWEPAMVTFRR